LGNALPTTSFQLLKQIQALSKNVYLVALLIALFVFGLVAEGGCHRNGMSLNSGFGKC
jgi:hypothetical protein